jgi:hypothetical protein
MVLSMGEFMVFEGSIADRATIAELVERQLSKLFSSILLSRQPSDLSFQTSRFPL